MNDYLPLLLLFWVLLAEVRFWLIHEELRRNKEKERT